MLMTSIADGSLSRSSGTPLLRQEQRRQGAIRLCRELGSFESKPDISGRNTPGGRKSIVDNQQLTTEVSGRPFGFPHAASPISIPSPLRGRGLGEGDLRLLFLRETAINCTYLHQVASICGKKKFAFLAPFAFSSCLKVNQGVSSLKNTFSTLFGLIDYNKSQTHETKLLTISGITPIGIKTLNRRTSRSVL